VLSSRGDEIPYRRDPVSGCQARENPKARRAGSDSGKTMKATRRQGESGSGEPDRCTKTERLRRRAAGLPKPRPFLATLPLLTRFESLMDYALPVIAAPCTARMEFRLNGHLTCLLFVVDGIRGRIDCLPSDGFARVSEDMRHTTMWRIPRLLFCRELHEARRPIARFQLTRL